MLFSTAALSITFPMIDPVLVEIGPLAIRWYALSYVAGILLGWWYIGKLDKKTQIFVQKAYDDFIIWAIFGILLGGRLGYVLFYNLPYYSSNPSEILAVWKGGMSFHGGLIGVIISIYLMCRTYKMSFLKTTDLICCAAPIGIFFGRIANFVNAELYGRITDVSWGVVFPGEVFARHPSQLYEALLEGLVLFLIMFFLVTKTHSRERAGFLSGFFLVGYSFFRASVELFREPDPQLGFIFSDITMGQMLSIPMFLIGVVLMARAARKENVS